MLYPRQRGFHSDLDLFGGADFSADPAAADEPDGWNSGFDWPRPTAPLGCAAFSAAPGAPAPAAVAPAALPRLGTVDARFQSFNVEMVEVIGGRFWKPYGTEVDALLQARSSTAPSGATPVGMDPGLYQQRPPIDLANPRLRALAAALGPTYLRVSGTWANTVYFHDSDAPAPAAPPSGFNGVLTRQQWQGVVDFSRAVEAKIVTSFATSAGTRDTAGVWTPTQARQFLASTAAIGGEIAAAEYMNEPTVAAMGGAPKGYDAAAFGRDLAAFRPFIKQTAPDLVLLGPGSVGEGAPWLDALPLLKSQDLLAAAGPVFDAFSYHFYGAVSKRCAAMLPAGATTPAAALTEEWLSRTETVAAFYQDLRDRFEPGKPLWLTETADAACGGNPWASTFLDSFRYLEQLGRLAKQGVQVVIHNTLAASDYGLLDEETLTPRPNYWAALLWRRLMGATVLDAGPSPTPNLHRYAHSLRDHPGGVALLVVNTDRTAAPELVVPLPSERYTLTARDLPASDIQLNGRHLRVGADGAVPRPTGAPTAAGTVRFAPLSITFLALPNANNPNCR